jgi:hypothetical protein
MNEYEGFVQLPDNFAHDDQCTCAPCRHERFNPGPPSNPRRFTNYGHRPRGRNWKKKRDE